MESGGAPNRINISEPTYRRVKNFFTFESRGRVLTKEKKELEMFSVTEISPGLLIGGGGSRRPLSSSGIATYFGKDLPAFPPFLNGTSEQAAVG